MQAAEERVVVIIAYWCAVSVECNRFNEGCSAFAVKLLSYGRKGNACSTVSGHDL